MNNNKESALKLLSKMTLKEKISQIVQKFYGFEIFERDKNGDLIICTNFLDYVKQNEVPGVISNFFRADPWTKRLSSNGGIKIEEREKAYNILQRFIVEHSRLKIPAIFGEDDPHGRMSIGSPSYPVGLNIGCSFNPELYEKEMELIGKESIIGGNHLSYVSIFDMALDPRWGRYEECFSEDPYLTSKFAEAAVKGIKKSGAMICSKHLAAQGALIGGHNGCYTTIGENELREIHLPPVISAIENGTDFIMAAYNDIDGIPCHANRHLLKDILEDELGFHGVVYSDACAIDNLVALTDDDYEKAIALAISSGVSLTHCDYASSQIENAISHGYLKESDLDNAVLKLLIKKYEMGLMDNPFLEEKHQSLDFINSNIYKDVAYDMAKESLVLLKNEGGLLPLKKQKILLMGANTNNCYYLTGDYTGERLKSNTLKDIVIDNGGFYLEGWNFENGITCIGEELKNYIEKCDVIVYGVGGSSARGFESSYNKKGYVDQCHKFIDCGEGTDLASLELPKYQKELLLEISKYHKPIISLLIMGRPYIINEIVDMSTAVLWCGYCGDEGHKAILDALYGRTNDFGRLSISIPKHVGQLPVCYNYRCSKDYIDIDNKPLFPFGYGLSYSSFIYRDLFIIDKTIEELNEGKQIEVSFTVKNISSVKGKEVVQLYIKRFGGTILHRNKELAGFSKIELNPNEERRITLYLGKKHLLEYSIHHKYEIISMSLTIMIGKNSSDIILKDKIRIS